MANTLLDENWRDVFCELSRAIWQPRTPADHAALIDRALKKHVRLGLVIDSECYRVKSVRADEDYLLVEIEKGEIVRRHIDAARWRFY